MRFKDASKMNNHNSTCHFVYDTTAKIEFKSKTNHLESIRTLLNTRVREEIRTTDEAGYILPKQIVYAKNFNKHCG